jgi:hypothetical protein
MITPPADAASAAVTHKHALEPRTTPYKLCLVVFISILRRCQHHAVHTVVFIVFLAYCVWTQPELWHMQQLISAHLFFGMPKQWKRIAAQKARRQKLEK